MTIDGESKVLIDSVAHCCFVYHRLYIDCPGLKSLLQKSVFSITLYFVFSIKAVYVGFVVDEILGQVYWLVLIFFPVSCYPTSTECCAYLFVCCH
jgi:hypothetical protein